jgi:hypothetical protein
MNLTCSNLAWLLGLSFVGEGRTPASALAQRIGFIRRAAIASCVFALFASDMASAQDKGTLHPEPLPPLAKPAGPATPAKQLFARKTTAAELPTRSIGFYSKGCLAGAAALPVSGETWQVMRLSRNRNWGHPVLVEFIEELSERAAQNGWPGLLIGDMSQPRGGPMLNGHASHQVGLDVDIWLTPMPHHDLTRIEREAMMATMVVAHDRKDVDRNVDAGPCGADQGCGRGPAGHPHLREHGDQEGALPGRRQRSRMAEQGAALARP